MPHIFPLVGRTPTSAPTSAADPRVGLFGVPGNGGTWASRADLGVRPTFAIGKTVRH